jgi:DNA-directed RNA polymerase subunit H (RpoH/RPB5)
MKRFFKIHKVLNEMLIDRCYIIPRERLNMSFEDFCRIYNLDNIREKFQFVVQDDMEKKCLILLFDMFKKTQLEKTEEYMNEYSCPRCICIINDKIKKIGHTIPDKINKLKTKGLIVETFFEKELTFNMSKSIYVPKHIILGEIEKNNLLKNLKGNKLESINKSEPQCRYIGALENDIIKIYRYNNTSGKDVNYRLVI